MSSSSLKERDAICLFVKSLLVKELAKESPDFVPLSICLGLIEASLTKKDEQRWPTDIEVTIDRNVVIFNAFADSAAAKLDKLGLQDLRSKVKAVSDLVWGNLTGAYSNDVQHVQHLYTFTRILEAQKKQTKRQLDCAGVVLATLATCQHVAERHQQHCALASCRLQVSEDHCWLNYDNKGSREGSVEVTVDAPAKRGQVVSESSWQGWLYTGGHAVLCSPKMALTASIASINPSIIARQNTGTDSEALQGLQCELLSYIQQKHPEEMYPAALCTLADLKEIESQEQIEEAVLAAQHDAAVVEAFDNNNNAHAMFKEAIIMSQGKHVGGGRAWYPYSFMSGYLLRRAKYLLGPELQALRGKACMNLAVDLIGEAAVWCCCRHAASVLHKFRYAPVDDQLYKDVEGILELFSEALISLQKANQSPLEFIQILTYLLELWDGVCHCWRSQPKPSSWIDQIIKVSKQFTPECRQASAESAEVSSQVMLQARALWRALKPSQLKTLFGTAGVDEERPVKRNRQR